MIALQTSMPGRVPAKAVAASGIAVRAVIGERLAAAGPHLESVMEHRPFHKASDAVLMSSGGAPAI